MLMTRRGFVDIEFRNSSNGYYSGECLLWKEGIWNWSADRKIEWTRLTEDFTEGL